MAIATQDDDEVMSEINMIPFIDVMLVLLIIFIITVPVIQHAVKVELPQAAAQPLDDQAEQIRLSVDAQGQYFWNDEALSDEALEQRLVEVTNTAKPPALHISADKAVRYERVALALANAQLAGLNNVGFVTEPK
jgi:biopolymer transport protein ExbD